MPTKRHLCEMTSFSNFRENILYLKVHRLVLNGSYIALVLSKRESYGLFRYRIDFWITGGI